MAAAVTDTHPLIWFASGRHRKLSRRALQLFRAARQGTALIYVPAVALWEVGMLARIGRVVLEPSFPAWTENLLALPGFELVPLDRPILVAAVQLGFTADPFDAAIVATAQAKDLPLITADEHITEADVVDIAW